ncbi:MAG: histidine kinase [Clostridia bacterium]|nr:histidine kinase [Clostridia bacterium]
MKRINNLSSIRGTLIGYSFLVVFLMTILSFYTLGIMNQYQKQVSNMFEHHIFLNDLEKTMKNLDSNLLGFLTTKSSGNLNAYNIERENINGLLEEYHKNDILPDQLLMKNVDNLIKQYILESDLAVTFKRQRNVSEYSKHYDRTKKIQSFIFEYTQAMNQEQLTVNSNAYINMINQTHWLQMTTVFIIIDLIVFSVLIVYMLTSKMLKPISALYKSAEAISEGNFETPDVEIRSQDEFRLLANAFNNMKNSITRYIEAVKFKAETEAKLKDEQMKNLKMAYLLDNAKLNALQSQINPHFLFNTINAGVQLSVIEKATRTGHFLETMSRLFRYSLKMQHDHCTLADELSNIKDYYELLKVRFRDRIKFNFDVEDDALNVLMPAMILQPIVENSYIHGLSSLESGGTINIQGRSFNDYVEIMISDNGVGVEEHVLEAILNPPTDEEGIGVRNVKTRLELYFHQKQLFDMYNDHGVTTILRIPWTRRNDV